MYRIQKALPLALLLALALGATAQQKQIDIRELDGKDINSSGYRNLIYTAVPLLSIAPDSRAAAMGDAGVASTPDVNSQHWNIAKYALIPTKFGVSLSYIPWLRKLTNEINLAYLAGYYRIDKMQSVSASLRYFSMGQMVFTNEQGIRMQTHNPNEFAFDVGYSRKFLPNFSGGLGFRIIRSDLTGGFSNQNSVGTNKAGMSYAADLGIYYQHPLKLQRMPAEWAVGISITNIGSKLTYNDVVKNFIPITLRVGGRFSLNVDQYNAISALLDLSKLLVPTPPIYNAKHEITKGKDPDVAVVTGMVQSFYDAPGGAAEELHEIYLATGFEYLYQKLFALRAGYYYEHPSKGGRTYFTLGAGVAYNVFSLDAAYLLPTAGFNSPIANTMRFSLMVNFEQQNKKGKRAKQEQGM